MEDSTSRAQGAERSPDPSFDEGRLLAEITENTRRNRAGIERIIKNDPQSSGWLQNNLDASIESDFEDEVWVFLHEFYSLLPFLHTRESGEVPEDLQQDLDRLLEKLFGYERFVTLQKRLCELVVRERQGAILKSEADELLRIGKELGTLDLKSLYIDMRRLGYTPEKLCTKRGKKG